MSKHRNARQARSVRSKRKSGAKAQTTSLGDLISVAFDVVGDRVTDVTRLLSSRQMRRAVHARLVFV